LWSKGNVDRENESPSEVEENSRNRVRYILGTVEKDNLSEVGRVEIEKYCIQPDAPRTLEQYQEISGVDFRKGTISDKARYGGLAKDVFMEDVMASILALVANLNTS
jgi:hypothetical protein